MSSLPRVVFVDDEERILRSLRMLFRGRAEILATTSGQQAIEWVRQQPVHVVVSDQRMPEIGGVEVLRAVAQHSPKTMRILLTGYADLEAVTASVNEGEIFRFVEKPWDSLQLVDAVEQAARIAQAEFALTQPAIRMPALEDIAARVLVLDDDGSLTSTVRDMLPSAMPVSSARGLEDALETLAENDVPVLVARLSSSSGDIADALKQLKRMRPATLAIVISPLRDSRLVIGLINEGQIFRFLLQPAPRELLRRALIAALERHVQLRASSTLLQRHRVEMPRQPMPAALSERLQTVWRRLREATFARTG